MKNLLFLCLIFLDFGLNAQTPLSTSRVIYQAKHSLRSTIATNGKNTLHFDKNHCLYIHNNVPVKRGSIEESSNMGRIIPGDYEGLPVFIDLSKGEIFTKSDAFFGLCIIQEPLDTIVWTIDYNEQKTVKKYVCLKATGTFAGRDYEVWFTPEIPVPFGPFKLWGLPGLILEAKSIDGKVCWEFVGYEAVSSEPMEMVIPSNGRLLTWEEYVKAYTNFRLQKEATYPGVSFHDGPPDGTIEIGKFNIWESN